MLPLSRKPLLKSNRSSWFSKLLIQQRFIETEKEKITDSMFNVLSLIMHLIIQQGRHTNMKD